MRTWLAQFTSAALNNQHRRLQGLAHPYLHHVLFFASLMDPPVYYDGTTPATGTLLREAFQLRAYQAEMVEESMKANIIVVMDTGSGKTHV